MHDIDLRSTATIVLTMVLAAYDPLWIFLVPTILVAHRSWVQTGVREAQRQLEKKIDALTVILEARSARARSPREEQRGADAPHEFSSSDEGGNAPEGSAESGDGHRKIRIPSDNQDEASTVIELPRRNGRAHEVLGVPEDANTHLIQRAFRYWVKQYHPDRPHMASDVEMTRRLAEARAELLRRRLIQRYRKKAAKAA